MRSIVEQFPGIDIAQLRPGVGGRRKFNNSDSCALRFDDGRVLRIELVRLRTNLGYWQRWPKCPHCGRVTTVLRLVPFGVGVACVRDLRRELAAKYQSQLGRRPQRPADGRRSHP